MKIIDRLNDGRIHISFEVFPPKKDEDYEKVAAATDEIAKLDPAFISVDVYKRQDLFLAETVR